MSDDDGALTFVGFKQDSKSHARHGGWTPFSFVVFPGASSRSRFLVHVDNMVEGTSRTREATRYHFRAHPSFESIHPVVVQDVRCIQHSVAKRSPFCCSFSSRIPFVFEPRLLVTTTSLLFREMCESPGLTKVFPFWLVVSHGSCPSRSVLASGFFQ